MAKTTFVKALTLFSSISLVSLFLMYRTGIFDETDNASIQSSPNGGSMNNSIANDTTPPKKDSTKPLRLSSSKVLILTDQERVAVDTSKPVTDTTSKVEQKKEPVIFYGTKSGAVFKPNHPGFKVRDDSAAAGKKKKKKNKQ